MALCVNHRKPHKLGATSTPSSSWLGRCVGFEAQPTSRQTWLCGTIEEPDGFVGKPLKTLHASFVVSHYLALAWCWFSGVNKQIPHADFGCKPLPCVGPVLVLCTKPTNPARRLLLLATTLRQLLVHDFVLLFLPPCSPPFIPFATGSFEPSLLVSPFLRGHTSIDLLHLHFTCTKANYVTTYTYNAEPRVSTHNNVNAWDGPGADLGGHWSCLQICKVSVVMLMTWSIPMTRSSGVG
jgi:hypothetical protein